MVEHTENIRDRKKTHAHGRAEERHGLALTTREYKTLIHYIQEENLGKRGEHARFLEKLTVSRSLWIVQFNDVWYPVVYDKNAHLIVSFLPYDAEQLKPHLERLPHNFTRGRE